MAIVRAGRKIGADVVLTHADLPSNAYTIPQLQEAAALGAYVEHCYFTTYYNRVTIEEIAEQIRAVGCTQTFLSTDFGQTASPFSDEGIAQYADLLEGQGFTQEELAMMFREVPEKLLRK